MKEQLQHALAAALARVAEGQDLPEMPKLERTNNPAHGDFQSNVALQLSKRLGLPPRVLAEKIVAALDDCAGAQFEIAGPGFINIRLSQASETAVLPAILKAGAQYGHHRQEPAPRILLEFVSANPTGPLHVGHGRGAALGATLANLLRACGHQVECEYYVNDAGRQMDILTLSTYWRYLEQHHAGPALPTGLYQGDYVFELAHALQQAHGDTLLRRDWLRTPPRDWSEQECAAGQRDQWIDAAIADLKTALGADYRQVFACALNAMVADIREDLAAFGVHFERWFSEQSLFDSGKVEQALAILEAGGHLYQQAGATWFRATAFGDEKDRVVRRENGATTYFASDIAYHLDKYQRGYDHMIDIFGADHHGYMARVKASLAALQLDPERLEIALVQFAVLYRGGEKVQMSTRSGQFVTLRALRDAVGNDAARFFYALRKAEQHLDFDLDLATSHSKDNPFYYVEYAHARTCRVLERAAEAGVNLEDWPALLPHQHRLEAEEERALLRALADFPEVVAQGGAQRSAHGIITYLRTLAGAWHQFYDAGHKVLHEDEGLRAARVLLTLATRQVLRNALAIIGVEALEKM